MYARICTRVYISKVNSAISNARSRLTSLLVAGRKHVYGVRMELNHVGPARWLGQFKTARRRGGTGVYFGAANPAPRVLTCNWVSGRVLIARDRGLHFKTT